MKARVTTSWDDGHSGDLRLAELLADRAMVGTFYWTVNHPEFNYLDPTQTRDLLDMGMEIGSHTMTHPDLTKLNDDQLDWELTASKAFLEDYVQRPVRTFCYPFGYFNSQARRAVAAAGYELARTTEAFRTSTGRDPMLVPVTVHAYPHTAKTHLTHSVRRGNYPGLANWLLKYRGAHDLDAIVARSLDLVGRDGGVLHLWGHSWELERYDLWATLERLIDVIAGRDDIAYVTNDALI